MFFLAIRPPVKPCWFFLKGEDKLTIILGIFVFGLIIIFHELGHFTAARLSGVTVNEFTIGFGPALFSFRRNGTLFALRAIPFGGAVVMEDGSEGDQDPHTFEKAGIFKRFIIMFSGSAVNFIMGFVILFLVFYPMENVVTPVIGGFMQGFEHSGEQGLMEGDKILKINNSRVLLYNDISLFLSRGAGKPYDIVVKRHNAQVVIKNLMLEKKQYPTEGTGLYYGIRFSVKKLDFGLKLDYTWKNSLNFVRLIWISLSDLISGRAGINELSGPVGISVAISETAKQSVRQMWYFVAFLAINLSVMNLLPLPALDGGRLLFLFIELVRGRPANPKYENYIHLAGMLLLLLLLAYVTFNDIVVQFFDGGVRS